MSTIETKNAIINHANLQICDHGFLTSCLALDYGGSAQGFGNMTLYLPKNFSHHSLESPAGHFLFRVMEIAGVEKWSDLIGKSVRVRAEHSKVHAIGHIINDDWFCPEEDFKKLNEGKAQHG